MNRDKTYFKNLDGLRFVAAFMVMIHHCDSIRHEWSLPGFILESRLLRELGDRGVNIFFVLSGFLITYLLIQQEILKGRIAVRNFYLKRILRIWPLYFVIVILTFFILPNVEFLKFSGTAHVYYSGFIKEQLIYYLLFSVHFALIKFQGLPFGGPLWSVSVEEQFYLIWPLFLKFFKKTRGVALLVLAFLGYKVHAVLWQKVFQGQDPSQQLQTSYQLVRQLRIELFALGGLGAYLLFHYPKFLKPLFHPVGQALIWLYAGYVFFANPVLVPWVGFRSGPILREFFSSDRSLIDGLTYLLIILTLAANPRSWVSLEHPIFKKLGQISYGLYAYNWIVIVIVCAVTIRVFGSRPQGTLFFHALFYVTSVLATIGVAMVSYRFIEQRFLKIKEQLN